MDLLFVRYHAKDISMLYIPRLVDDVILIDFFLLIYSPINFKFIFYCSSIVLPFMNKKSILFFILPITTNTIMTFSIMSQENEKPKFFQWFIHNGTAASLLTILSCTDIGALNVLKSNLAGFESFNAPFSRSAKSNIIWGSIVNIFIEDIPQFTIQVRI